MADEATMIGEVIESSTTEFVAESRELHSPPPFGSFVKVRMDAVESPESDDPFVTQGAAPAIYAVVYQAATSPVDTGRRLRAFWKDEEQLREEQPEISEWMLVTDFRAIIIGYQAGGQVCQYLPPKPPKLFTQVHQCTPDEVRAVTERMDFLRALAGFRNPPSEEVIAACIRQANDARNNDFDFLVAAGKELASVLKDDYDRLQAIMRRVSP